MGAFWALVNINSLPMVYDLAKCGSIGAYTGLYYFASSAAAITGPIVAGSLIDRTSYASIWPFTALFLALAVVFMLLVRPAAGAVRITDSPDERISTRASQRIRALIRSSGSDR